MRKDVVPKPSQDVVPRLSIVHQPTHPTAYEQAVDYFIVAKEAQRCTPATLKHYRWTLEYFGTWLAEQGVTDPTRITAHHIRLFLNYLQSRDFTDHTVSDFARVIKTWCRFLVAEELLSANPFAKVTMPRLDKRIMPAFEQEDVRKLLAACDADGQARILVLLDTGVRVSEFVALDVGDVDLKTGTVRVRQGKGRKDRVVFLGAKAKTALRKHLILRGDPQPDEPLFPSYRHGRMTVDGMQTWLAKLGVETGVEHCHAHTFRRTFALWSLRSGMNIYALQQIMGHSDLTVLRKYLALVEEDLADAHRQHGAVDSML
jgi:site-specific recombinase XerD